MTTPGLRERRKQATRTALRDAAMTLFEQRGYAHVTVEEICAAADVSPRTFFRYHPTKDDVLLAPVLDLLEVVLTELRARPATESAWEALSATVTTLATRIEGDRAASLRSWRLLQTTPETLAANARGFMEWDSAMGAAVAARQGRSGDDLRARVLTGATMAAFRVAFDTWGQADGRGSLATMVGDALEVVAAGQRWAGRGVTRGRSG